MRQFFTTSTKVILSEAKLRGIKTSVYVPGHIAKLSYKNHIEYLYHQFCSQTSAVAFESCHTKDVTKELLKKNKVSVAKGDSFSNKEKNKAITYAKTLKWPLVLKPTNGAHGDAVFANIKNNIDFVAAWNNITKNYQNVIVEERFEGKEYRIFATENKLIGVINRIPANVIGDGKHTIQELVDIKNSDPRRGDRSYTKPLIKISIDDLVIKKLKKNHLTLKYTPKINEQIFLKDTSNLSTGGDSIDFTNKIHPSIKKIAINTVRAIPGLKYAGIDLMTSDITKQQTNKTYIIVEVNASPGLDMHHFPYEGKPRDAAGAIIDIMFPETKK